MTPVVSIVIPTYNRARELERALKAVIAQTFTHWEVVIVDNHSADSTEDVVNSFHDSRIRFYKNHNNGVIAASRNFGIRNASGEYIAFLDSDDWWTQDKLEISVMYLTKGADVVYHDLFLVRNPEQTFMWRKARTRSLKAPVSRDLLVNGNALTNSSVLIRRTILDRVGGLSEDPRVTFTEDFDLWLRTASVTERFTRIPQTLGYYQVSGGDRLVGGRNGGAPERIIESLAHFETIHASDFIESGCVANWRHYMKGKAYYQMGSYELARKHLELIPWRGMSFSYEFKIRWILFLIKMGIKSR